MRPLPCLLIIALIGAPATAEDWPQWRGPDRTEVSKETGLLKSWPSGGPKLLWSIDTLGIGHAGPAVADGKIYIMGEPDRSKGELLFCLDEATGKPVWAAPVGPHYDNGWGDGPRSTPTVDGKVVYAIGSKGDLVAVVAANGKVGWKQKLGGQVQGWGFTQSPLIDGKLVIAYEGGSGSIVAYDKMRGRPVWKSSRFGGGTCLRRSSRITGSRYRSSTGTCSTCGMKPADATSTSSPASSPSPAVTATRR